VNMEFYYKLSLIARCTTVATVAFGTGMCTILLHVSFVT
jgi:hypothetical protein